MARESLVKPEKAKQLRLDSISQLRKTTTDVKESIKTLQQYVHDGLLPEEEYEEAKDILVEVVADPDYQERVYVC
jgi:AICAR transformylase/IMP cyclohydrolase PurH